MHAIRNLICGVSLVLIWLSTLLAFASPCKTLFVDDFYDSQRGSGEQINPFRDLQSAFDNASDGDTIFIRAGTYGATPSTYIEDLCGNCQEHKTQVQASRGFLIKDKALTIIGSGKDSTILVTKAGYGVLFENSRGSLITKLTITGGKRDLDGMATDAGIVAKYSTVTVKQVRIADNTERPEDVVVGIGGVFGRENSELFIIGNEIINNGWDGVALYRGATAYIADNIIKDGRGAGIGITWDAVATVYRNRISDYWKGIGTFGNSRAVVRNNAAFENLGWGIIATGTSYMEASNNVIARNGNCGFAVWSDEAHGRAVNNIIVENGWRKEWVCPCVGVWMNGDSLKFPIMFNDVWGNVDGQYRDMSDLTDRYGNVSVDPQFLGPTDFRLPEDSPLIDNGDTLLTDPDGTRSDIGLFGGPACR